MKLPRRKILALSLSSVTMSQWHLIAHAAEPDEVKLAYVPELNAAVLFAAVEKGFFKQLGINLKLVRVNSAIEAAAFIANGQVDAGSLGLSAGIFNAIHRGFDMRIVATAASWGKEHSAAIVANKEEYEAGRLSKLTDIKGKRLAVAGGAGSGGTYLADTALRTVGLSIKDVTLVNLSNSDMPIAIRNKAVDAGEVGVPYSVFAISEGWGVPIIQNWQPGLANTQFFFSGELLRERRAVALRVFQALLLGSRSIQGPEVYSDENVQIFSKYMNVSPQIIKETKPLVYESNLNISLDSIIDQEKFFRESGYSEYKDIIKPSNIIDFTIQADAVQKIGNYK